MDIPEGIVDFHAHIWSDPSGLKVREQDEKQLLQMADRFKLDRVVVMPLFGGTRPTLEQVQAGNDAAAELFRKDERFVAFGRIEIDLAEKALSETKRCVEEYGMRGIKIWVSPANDPILAPVIEYAVDKKLPVLIHAMHKTVGQYQNESDPVDIALLAGRYPEATIILAHVGGDFIYGCQAVRETPNVLTDMSGTYCETGMVEFAVKTLGVGRILFGSDAPGASFINNVAKVTAANITEEEKKQILFLNARRLLG